MGWALKRTRRVTTSAALAGAIAIVSTVLPPAHAGTRPALARSFNTVAAKQPGPPTPQPPRLPRDFRGKGTWIVRDLGVSVPFSWDGRNGDSQMIAGGPQYPIWFTNLIYRGTLYTLTYKWPGVTRHPCSRFPGFDLNRLNQMLRGSRFVGREILQGNPNRYVNHWRAGVVVPTLPPGGFLRFPVALGDVYVDQNDRGTFRQVLQFGIQNLYDPQLDEWLVMRTFDRVPGTVTLPRRCS